MITAEQSGNSLLDNIRKRRAELPRIPTRYETEFHRRECRAWYESMNILIDVPPLPSSITPELQKKIENMGMELRFIPALNLGTLDDLKNKPVDSALGYLTGEYPEWNPYESIKSLSNESSNTNVKRKPEQIFWEWVRGEKINFPVLPGKWVAVETMRKPGLFQKYDMTQLTKILGFDDRFNLTWNQINDAIQNKKQEILAAVGLESGEVRMLEAIEWNLLGNREGWGGTNTSEWTNTEKRAYEGSSSRVFMGNLDKGGAGSVDEASPSGAAPGIGFRIAIILEP